MTSHAAFVRSVRVFTVALGLCTLGPAASALEETVVRTNLVDRWITNVIEVRMPLNRFVDEYHTNWVTECRTNVINLYTTNLLTRTLTNHFQVDAFRTNFVTAYQTNWQTLDLTNWQTAIVMETNWLSRTLTNQVAVDLFQTNLVTAYQTNWRTLELTNWQMAIVMRTNWVTQVVTNVVQVDAPAPSVAPAAVSAGETGAPMEAKSEPPAAQSAGTWSGPVILEAARTVRPPNNGQVEVQLSVRAGAGSGASFQVQQWRVEREDRAILCFGQEQEFKRELPVGRYKVEVKVRQDGDGAVLASRGTLVVAPTEATVEPTLAAKK
jgi:hypothetical protein